LNNFRKAGILCLTIGAVLILSALLLFVRNQTEDRRAGEAVQQVMPEIRDLILAKTEQNAQETTAAEPDSGTAEEVPSGSAPAPVPVTGGDAENAAEELPADAPVPLPEENKMTVEQIAGHGYIGILSIPALSLDLPVMDESTESNLKLAPCRDYGSLTTDDLVIAGHNYRQHFGYLSDLEPGDSVTFTDMNGTLHTFRVGAVEILDETDVDEMKDSPWALSLYTCTFNGSERLTIRCQRSEY